MYPIYPFSNRNNEIILTLINPNCFVATRDIKDAYYSIPISITIKYLKFVYIGKPYQIACFLNGFVEDHGELQSS